MWEAIVDQVGQFFLKVALPILLTAVLGLAAAWIKEQTARIRNQRIREALDEAIERMVRAAEQLYGTGRGEEKFDYVMNRLHQEGLAKYADPSHIEAKVNRIFPNFPDPAPDADGPSEEEDNG